jgi:hypothetical protein
MLGRWHGPGKGFVLVETKDLKALNQWFFRWTDLLEFNGCRRDHEEGWVVAGPEAGCGPGGPPYSTDKTIFPWT